MKKLIAMVLCLCMAVTLLPTPAMAEGSVKNIQLGVSGIADPTATTNGSKTYYTPNSYVYFGVNGDESKPIKWRVLDADRANNGNSGPSSTTGTSGMFLLSEYLLASSVQFDNDGTSNAYQGSDAQSWNNTFASNTSNFTSNEQSAMLGVAKTDASESSLYDLNWGESSLTANDKTFFLSVRELADYVGNYDGAPGLAATFEGGAAGWWWLRSPYARSSDYAGVVGRDGWVNHYYVNFAWAARPAFNLNLESVLFTSAAEGGKSGAVGADAIFEIPTPATAPTEWKLTLKDSTRNFAVTQTTATGKPGETITLDYTGATVGTNEYISVIIADGSGAKYYGRLMRPTAASGTVSLTIPSGLAAGSYTLKVFSEQYNGNKRTDYASPFVNISLTVVPTYTAMLDTAGLTGATVALDKTSGILANDTVTVTIIPDAGRVFDAPPTVTVTGANAGAVTAGANGTYTCQINGFTTDATIYVSGNAAAPIVPTLPQTGDSSHIALWGAMLMLSVAGMLMLLRRRMKTE